MQKKHYVQPTITDHGNAVEQTKGLGGRCWEVVGRSYNGVGEGGSSGGDPETGSGTSGGTAN